MVKLEEVQDEEFMRTGEKVYTDDEDDYTDTDSEISADDDYQLDTSETILERMYALKDMIPPTTRRKLVSGIENTFSWTKSGLLFGGKAIFMLSTSALLIAVPLGMAVADEHQAMEFERDQKMREMGNEMLSGGGAQDAAQDEAKPTQ